MKKLYIKNPYKNWHNKRSRKIGLCSRKAKKYDQNHPSTPIYRNHQSEFIIKDEVNAPENLSLLEKPESCLKFFKEIRSTQNINKIGHICFVKLSLKEVKKFDFSTICILIAIIGDLKSKSIYIRTNYPDDKDCKEYMIESGLLNVLFDEHGKPFKKSEKSQLLFIEKGTKKLSTEDNIRISNTVKNVVRYLTGKNEYHKKLRTILLEICGNSIEWGGTINKQWLLGVKYDNSRVIFTITDVGNGILRTLNKKFRHYINETFTSKSEIEILKGAFDKKYGSTSKQVNRNKGLPSIKKGYDDGLLKNLKVVTNNVILHFDNNNNSISINKKIEFKGTLYRWIITKESLKVTNYENN